MFRDVSFGQYYPTNSVIHRLDARAKLIFSVLYLVTVFFIQSYFSYIMVAIFLIAIILASKVPLIAILKSLRSIIFIVLFTAVLNLFFVREGKLLFHFQITRWWFISITYTGLHTSAKLAIRLVLLIMGASLVSLTTTPVELTDAMESLMKPLKVIRFPVHDIAVIMSIALRFIPTLLEETGKIINAQKARGAAFDTGGLIKRAKAMLPILIPLFVSSFRRADELALALDARCYNATEKRTRFKIPRFKLADLVAAVVMAAFICAVMLDRFYFGNLDKIIFGLVY